MKDKRMSMYENDRLPTINIEILGKDIRKVLYNKYSIYIFLYDRAEPIRILVRRVRRTIKK